MIHSLPECPMTVHMMLTNYVAMCSLFSSYYIAHNYALGIVICIVVEMIMITFQFADDHKLPIPCLFT